MKLLKPPRSLSLAKLYQNPIVFLAGTIEMGNSEDWQTQVASALANEEVTICNPRRDDWDSSWHQDIENDKFAEQVTWELEAMQMADIIAMHFEPETKSPITLMELGLHVDIGNDVWCGNQKLIVHCPEGFWRKGNVDIVCKRYKVNPVETIESLIDSVKTKVKKINESKNEDY